MYEKFDLLDFISKRANVLWIKQTMEIKLHDFKTKYPESDTTEQQKMIDTLGVLYLWLYEYEKEYNAIRTNSIENSCNNLFLVSKIKDLEKEITVLKHMNNENN